MTLPEAGISFGPVLPPPQPTANTNIRAKKCKQPILVMSRAFYRVQSEREKRESRTGRREPVDGDELKPLTVYTADG